MAGLGLVGRGILGAAGERSRVSGPMKENSQGRA
jgi:hypothetical protein